MERTANCQAKLARLNAALQHREGDRVPVTDFFWSAFIERWRKELGLPADASPYRYYDLDMMVTIPNMDPHIHPFEVLKETAEEVVVRTGFEAVIQRKTGLPMPDFLRFETDTLEKMAAFRFDDPADDRRFFAGGDNQLGGVGDTLTRNLPPWIDGVRSNYPDIPVFGSVCEAHELLWRIIGTEQVMLWLGLYPDEIARFVERITEFNIGLCEAQIKAARGLLAGMVVWGDVAYRRGMFFSPDTWRRIFRPCVQELIAVCHRNGLPVVYHGCGNARAILPDLVDIGLDCYNPLEAKAGMDPVDLRRKLGHRLAFCGGMDVQLWADGTMEDLTAGILTRLNAAKGGGYIFASDHSVPSNISGERYDYAVRLVREKGDYPLRLGQYDQPDLGV